MLLLHHLSYSQELKVKKITVVNFDQFEPNLHFQNDTVYLVNFWATWCAPCRQELPAIQKVGEKYSQKKIKILLVSLDLANQLESRLMPFVHSNQIKQDVYLLDDPNQNRWIDKVDPGWSGEIPFTLIYGKDFRKPYARTFNFETLDSIIHQKLNLP